MWPRTFADRLESWNALRNQAATADVESALTTINQWWFSTPWIPYHLHWDDRDNWPETLGTVLVSNKYNKKLVKK